MSNLSHQFDDAIAAYENMQRRRYARKKGVSGFIGNGYWFGSYPYMMGAYGAGTITQTQPDKDNNDLSENLGQTADTSNGMGDGGTASSGMGAEGGSGGE
jgi:hypothetical protein